MDTIPREKINEDMNIVLKTIFHYERIGIEKFHIKIEEVYTLLFLRDNPNARVTDLSKELQLPMFTISRLVNRLTIEGLLSKEQDQTDKRNYLLHLLPKGMEILQKIESASYERISKNFASMSDEEVRELLNLAGLLHVVLGVTKDVFH
jgi:DNA-binding MarR family transcriptional regulator